MSERERERRRASRVPVATVEDADDYGNVIEGTASYAASLASPTKEKPNTGKTRRDKARRESISPPTAGYTDSDSTVHPRREKESRQRLSTKEKEKEKERYSSSRHKAIVTTSNAVRPAAKHSKTVPNLQGYKRSDESTYYGINDPATVTAAASYSRPANRRPASYYGTSSRPPLASAKYYSHFTAPPPTALPLPTSFPPNQWATGAPSPFANPSPVASQMQHDYFMSRTPAPNPLHARFSRPSSAMGYRPPPTQSFDEYEPEPDRGVSRRSSVTRKNELARRAMPPPQRPATTRPTTLPFRPPPQPATPAQRRSVQFDDEDLGGDASLFQDVSPYSYHDAGAAPRRRRPSVGSVNYDVGQYRTEVATPGSRRNSYYNDPSSSSGSAYEDKMRQATSYQDGVQGGPTMPLTAEHLKRAGKNGGSRGSTRSSGSHDESDYRRSATTRTTRSSTIPNDEDVTIRVKGSTVLKVGGAEMQCEDGAEINISSRSNGYRGGSDRSSYMDPVEDRRSRLLERTAGTRTRNSSQADSFSRAAYRYDSGYALPPTSSTPFSTTAPFPPPYPAYPGTEFF